MHRLFSAATRFCATSLAVLLLAGCGGQQATIVHTGPEYPSALSAWGVLQHTTGRLNIARDAQHYTLNTALFSDYAHKLRTVHLPDGTAMTYEATDTFTLPVGSVISKTFFYFIDAAGHVDLDAQWDESLATLATRNIRLIETRLLVKQSHGWDALPYVWQGEDAYLRVTGDLLTLPTQQDVALNYLVPSGNQCASCHATDHSAGDIKPIGLKARHLNRKHPATHTNQLQDWIDQQQLANAPAIDHIPVAAQYHDKQHSIDARARAYLDINCAHCHSPTGPADTSGLLLNYDNTDLRAMGRCKPPIAAGRGTGGHLYGIVPGQPDESIMLYRLKTTNPGTMMPELGRSLVHEAGVSLIASWIDELTGECR